MDNTDMWKILGRWSTIQDGDENYLVQDKGQYEVMYNGRHKFEIR
jgi:hypothetical protein